MTPIAVIGIDCRFPGAPHKDAFWRLLIDGVVADSEVPSQRWNVDEFYHPDGVAGTTNSRRGHFIDDVDAFDNEFFGITPVEAAALDPQQRLLIQTCWRALEDGAINPRSLAGTSTGVFIGLMSAEWGNIAMLDFAGITPFSGAGSGSFMAANRISYHLDLTGPSVVIDTGCSSSLMAIHYGCAALRSGDVDTVIAAGANVILLPALSIFYAQAGLSAPDGRCKPFGQSADGIGRGEGVAAVVLRRLDDAIADGQPIYAVVRSSVANHDGRSNGITAPSRSAQVALMRRALTLAEIDATDIAFVEGHGSGTVVGDMIEVSALGDLHKTRASKPCLLGSVKGNIGHTEGSAGIAGFVKACLAIHHRVLPPTVFGKAPSAQLRLNERGLQLTECPQELSATQVRGAVSSFGLGGSNAHVVLESAPAELPALDGPPGGPLRRIPAHVFDTTNRFWFSGGAATLAPSEPTGVHAVGEGLSTGTEHALIALIADVGGHSIAKVTRSSRLDDDLGYDSLLQIHLLDRLRSDYPRLAHIAVSDLLPHLDSVGTVVDFVIGRVKSASETRVQ